MADQNADLLEYFELAERQRRLQRAIAFAESLADWTDEQYREWEAAHAEMPGVALRLHMLAKTIHGRLS